MKRRVILALFLTSLLLVTGTEGHARSCVERPLGDYSVIFATRIVQILPENRMIVALAHDLRGNETRPTLIIDTSNVAVWTDRTVFKRGAEWLFAFQEKAKEYDIVLCKTPYIPLQDGNLSVNIDGSGYQSLTVRQLGRRLVEKGE